MTDPSGIAASWQKVKNLARPGYEKKQITRIGNYAEECGLPPNFSAAERDVVLLRMAKRVHDPVKLLNSGLNQLQALAKRRPDLNLHPAPRIKMDSQLAREAALEDFDPRFLKSLEDYTKAQSQPVDHTGRQRTVDWGAVERHPSSIRRAACICTEGGHKPRTIGDLLKTTSLTAIINSYGDSIVPAGGRDALLSALRQVAEYLKKWDAIELIDTKNSNMGKGTDALSREMVELILRYEDDDDELGNLLGSLSKVAATVEDGFPKTAVLGHVQGAFGALFCYFFNCYPQIAASIKFAEEETRASRWGRRPLLIATALPEFETIETRFGDRLRELIDLYYAKMPDDLKAKRLFYLNDYGDPISQPIITKRISKEIQKIDEHLTTLTLVGVGVAAMIRRKDRPADIALLAHYASLKGFLNRYGPLITAITGERIKAGRPEPRRALRR